MMSIHGYTQTLTAPLRPKVLALLATLAVSAGALTAPVAAIAHAGSVCRTDEVPRLTSGSIVPDCPLATPGPVQVPGDGRKPGVSSGGGV